MPSPPFETGAPQPGEFPQWLSQMLQPPAPRPAPAPVQKRVAAKPAAPAPPPQSVVASAARSAESKDRAHPSRLLANRKDLVRAVVAAEVLGKPRGLREEYPWY
jgi:hypothetical protein